MSMQEEQVQESTTMVEEVQEPLARVTVFAENLCKHFKHAGELIAAVDDVQFSFTERQFVAITGPSGSGKTTLLYLMGALDKANSGKLMVDGVDIIGIPAWKETTFRRQHVGFVFQSFNLVPNLSALENVRLPMDLAGKLKASERDIRAQDLLLQVGLPVERHNHRPGKLSAGQQQRVAVARALANDPPVILADEPTGNLDSKNSRVIIDLLKRLAHEGKTVIVVTHDRGIANQADLWLELTDGRIETMFGKPNARPQTALPSLKHKKARKRR